MKSRSEQLRIVASNITGFWLGLATSAEGFVDTDGTLKKAAEDEAALLLEVANELEKANA